MRVVVLYFRRRRRPNVPCKHGDAHPKKHFVDTRACTPHTPRRVLQPGRYTRVQGVGTVHIMYVLVRRGYDLAECM